MALVSRDPFARVELHRESVVTGVCGPTCAWCGGHGRYLGPRYGSDDPRRLFRYRVESDGGRKEADDRLFCSVGCRRTYYGG